MNELRDYECVLCGGPRIKGHVICSVCKSFLGNESEANAKLISKAPEMYEALKDIKEIIACESFSGKGLRKTISNLIKSLNFTGLDEGE